MHLLLLRRVVFRRVDASLYLLFLEIFQYIVGLEYLEDGLHCEQHGSWALEELKHA